MPEKTTTHLRLSWGDVLAVHYQTGDYTSLGIWAQDNVPSLIEQLEAAQAELTEWRTSIATEKLQDQVEALRGIAENGACASDARVAREALGSNDG